MSQVCGNSSCKVDDNFGSSSCASSSNKRVSNPLRHGNIHEAYIDHKEEGESAYYSLEEFYSIFDSSSGPSITAVIDSGASRHIFRSKSIFEKIYLEHEVKIVVAGESTPYRAIWGKLRENSLGIEFALWFDKLSCEALISVSDLEN